MTWPNPPSDYGSDRYDYVEVDAPEGIVPTAEFVEQAACLDCRCNLFLRWEGTRWHVTVAHDDGCPRLQQKTGA